jgi:hypothetical protein
VFRILTTLFFVPRPVKRRRSLLGDGMRRLVRLTARGGTLAGELTHSEQRALEHGRIVHSDTADEIRDSVDIRRRWLEVA